MEIAIQIEEGKVGHVEPLVEGINRSFETNKVYLVAGLNGSGKTTLLRTMAGLQPPLAGSFKLFGEPISELNIHQKAQKLRYQGARVDTGASLSVREVIELGARSRNLAVEDIASRFQVEHLLDRSFSVLSDGERQKTLLASVWIQETPVVLLDEPTSFLDYKAKPELLNMIVQEARNDGKCLIFSSHDLEIAKPLVDEEVWVGK